VFDEGGCLSGIPLYKQKIDSGTHTSLLAEVIFNNITVQLLGDDTGSRGLHLS
jgi:hypothetical protein